MVRDGEDSTAEGLRLALRASEARFRNVIGANADGVVVTCREGVIGYVNPAAAALLGRPAGVLIGHAFGIPIVPGATTEVDIPRADGPPRVAELRVVETEWDGAPALLASLRDVTERKQLEEELRRQAGQLAEADRRKDEFLAMLAHELRNPLAPIRNAAYMLRHRGADPAVLVPMREVIEEQVKHLARLVDDLLDVSRITRGKIRLAREPIDLVAVATQAAESARPQVEARRHALAVELPPGPIPLEADPTRIKQVLLNLLDNAAKYTDPGGAVRLSVAREGPEAVVRVRDSGIGIAPDVLPRIFDLFAQADCSLDRSRGGLGIGLTLVKSLVELHGGSVSAHSAGVGRGCEVVVRLPAPAPPARPTGLPAVSPGPAAGASRRILVVDDNVQAAESLAVVLRLWGHEVLVHHDGPAAIAAAPAFGPDVVLLDIGLPDLDGYEVARRLRARPDLPGLRLLAMTGYGRDEDRRRAAAAGFDHHLTKPVDLDALKEQLDRR